MKTPVKLMISGALFLIGGFILGVGGTLAGLVRSYERVAESATSPSSEQIASGVNLAFVATTIGIAMALIGLCLAVGGLVTWFVRKP